MDYLGSNSSVFDLPFISVVVPAYNEEKNIAACIEALLAQSYPECKREIIIVDNNSTDGTLEIVKLSPVILQSEKNIQTPAAARNRGILAASGAIVAFTDADCIPDPGWLMNIIGPFVDPSIVGVVGLVTPLHHLGLISEFLVETDPVRSRQYDNLWYVATANAAFRRTALLEIGLFNPDLYTAEDVDLGLRLQLNGYGRIMFANEAIVRHPFPNTIYELIERFHRYGYSEVLLDAMNRDLKVYPRSQNLQFRIIKNQILALLTYIISFFYRLLRSFIFGWERKYLAWPILWFLAEGSNLLGKIQGLIHTRMLMRNPFTMSNSSSSESLNL